jgi:hypothetical protein
MPISLVFLLLAAGSLYAAGLNVYPRISWVAPRPNWLVRLIWLPYGGFIEFAKKLNLAKEEYLYIDTRPDFMGRVASYILRKTSGEPLSETQKFGKYAFLSCAFSFMIMFILNVYFAGG